MSNDVVSREALSHEEFENKLDPANCPNSEVIAVTKKGGESIRKEVNEIYAAKEKLDVTLLAIRNLCPHDDVELRQCEWRVGAIYLALACCHCDKVLRSATSEEEARYRDVNKGTLLAESKSNYIDYVMTLVD